jgi:AcrR family transcriptional regulator
MRQVQATAVEMFERDGFDATTVEEVAEQAGVSPSTVYRHFGTKETLVLWDERDGVVDQELAARLGRQPPVEAFRDSVVVALAERDDLELFGRRLRLNYAQPTIWRAAAELDLVNRVALATAFAAVHGRRRARLTDEVCAAACLAALDVALERWQRPKERATLARLIAEAIDAVAVLG